MVRARAAARRPARRRSSAGRSVTHTYTREDEDAFEYVCRHTLLRPRDLMTIGQRLAGAAGPRSGATRSGSRKRSTRAPTEIAHEYLTEIAPYIGDLDLERCLRRLPGHILTRDEVEKLFREHNVATRARRGEARLLRAVPRRAARLRPPRPGPRRMGAALPAAGRGRPSSPTACCRKRRHYFVHPVLSDVVGRLNPAYLQRVDRINIVGYGRPWRLGADWRRAQSRPDALCPDGDVHGFGELMRPGADAPVRQALEEAVRKWAPRGGGRRDQRRRRRVGRSRRPGGARPDRASHDRRRVSRRRASPACASRCTMARCRRAEQASDGSLVIAGGDAVLCAARIEPHVEPGQIWATEEFRQQLAPTPSLWRTTPVPGRMTTERFNVKKATEPDLWVRLNLLSFATNSDRRASGSS